MRSNLSAFLAVLLCTSAASPAFAAASLTPLGDLPGGDFRSVATGVSADGSTVVGFSGLGAGQEAFRWTSAGGIVGLGDLPGGIFESLASGVSADGSVVVGYGTTVSGREAFLWTSDGGMVGLGDLPGGALFSEAYRVSADGSVVVGRGSSASGFQAFRWTSGGGMVGLGFPEAWDVTGDGSVVVGGGSLGGIVPQAVRWTSDGGAVGLGVLPDGGVDSAAFGVSADGSVVVGWGRSQSGGFRLNLEAFRWTSDSGMIGLGDLPGGLFESFAYDVSGDGSIVVGYGSSASGTEAFLWTSDGGMKRLWEVLLAQGIDPAADGWTNLTNAEGISADGNTIVGFGTRNGNTEAFVAVIPTIVPEPAAGALALLGVNGILLLRRRRAF
ncbi:MAG: PEP-CTERM sorting domain-containing protein [Pirellulales bacterium]|nr:PEP-CTERM sorting domain-containing protein [Pirellulales bacterium]